MEVGILGKIFLTEVVVFLVSSFLMIVDIDTVVRDENDKMISCSNRVAISGIIMLISLISIIVTVLIGIWMM
jgi:amino acid transporter